jgi:hypothetical protein
MATQPHDEHAARSARTQCLFRDVNERVREINEAFSIALPLGDWICECARDECVERLPLSQSEYESIRANARRFLVAPDSLHVVDGIENVVDRSDRFWVVEKIGEAGDLAASVDPRAVGLRGRAEYAVSRQS